MPVQYHSYDYRYTVRSIGAIHREQAQRQLHVIWQNTVIWAVTRFSTADIY